MTKKRPYDLESPFMEQLRADAEALENGQEIMTVNGAPMGQAIWNLILTKRDLSNYCAKFSDGRQMKIIPTRGWKVSHVKKYYGIKGTGDKLLESFMALFNDVMDEGGDEQ